MLQRRMRRGCVHGVGRVRSLVGKRRKENEFAQHSIHTPPKSQQRHGDRGQLETVCDETSPTRTSKLARFFCSRRVCGNRSCTALAINETDRRQTYTKPTGSRQPRPTRDGLRQTKQVPRVSPSSPASVDPGFVEIGSVQLSQSVIKAADKEYTTH